MKSNYDKNPTVPIEGVTIWAGWNQILPEWVQAINQISAPHKVFVFECYTGVHEDEIKTVLKDLKPDRFIHSEVAFKSPAEISSLTLPDVTDDRIFGFMTKLTMQDFLDQHALEQIRSTLTQVDKGLTIIFGPGASVIADKLDPSPDTKMLLTYVDMARWEIQNRMKEKSVHGLGIDDHQLDFSYQYKRGYFVDWRVCDQLKQSLYDRMDYVLDTNAVQYPKMITGNDLFKALSQIVHQPFRVVPYFDPGPWGGQWMKEVCDLDRTKANFAWCFDCVPEENSLKFDINGIEFETPAINLVFQQAANLLGKAVESRFGKEFPIRFDFLDTMGGGNLSFQVHPSSQYIREKFGLHYTQDESYYLLDADEDATVYLGIKSPAQPGEMLKALTIAQEGGPAFSAEEFVNIWPAKKHDHFLIPAGTVHCSGKNSMVLEISSTPYIFTFKMWDWNRLGLDGKPRPINLKHAEQVIDWSRDTDFARDELVNQVEELDRGPDWREERTGLHRFEFIETRRHWFSGPVTHHTNGSVNVLNLVEGREAVVKSPTGAFKPFVVHYAETFIIPEHVEWYIIEPHGESINQEIATIKASVRI